MSKDKQAYRVSDLISKYEKLCTPKKVSASTRKINTRSLLLPSRIFFNPPKHRTCVSFANDETLDIEIQNDVLEVFEEQNKQNKNVRDSETQTCIVFSGKNKAFINECPEADDLDLTLKIFNEKFSGNEEKEENKKLEGLHESLSSIGVNLSEDETCNREDLIGLKTNSTDKLGVEAKLEEFAQYDDQINVLKLDETELKVNHMELNPIKSNEFLIRDPKDIGEIEVMVETTLSKCIRTEEENMDGLIKVKRTPNISVIEENIKRLSQNIQINQDDSKDVESIIRREDSIENEIKIKLDNLTDDDIDLEVRRAKALIAKEDYYKAIINDSSDGYQNEETIYQNIDSGFFNKKLIESEDDNWVENDMYGSVDVEMRRKITDPIYATIEETEDEYEDEDEEESSGRNNTQSMIVQVNKRSDSESDSSYYYKESTIYDANKNLRIKSIIKVHMDKNKINDGEEDQKIMYKDRQEYIVDELIKTEEKYIKNLEYVVEKYLNYMRETILSGCLVGKCNYIFVNIEKIHMESTIFLEDLKLYKSDYEELGKLFRKHKNLLNRYPIYCRSNNKATSYLQGDFKQIVKQRELELDDKLGLGSHLLKPIQRLGKYELLLTRLYNCLEMEGSPSESVKDAILLVQQVTRRGNDLITIDSIESNPFSIIDTGDFVMRENFRLLSPKRDIVLFLFKKMIIITYKDSKSIDRFVYKENILITSLCLINMEGSLTFTIEDYYKKKKKDSSSFQIECKDIQVKELWMKEIQDMLWTQLHEHREAAKRQQSGDIRRSSLLDCKPEIEEYKAEQRAQNARSIFFVDFNDKS